MLTRMYFRTVTTDTSAASTLVKIKQLEDRQSGMSFESHATQQLLSVHFGSDRASGRNIFGVA